LQIAAIAAERAAGTNHAVTWHSGVSVFPHDGADRPPRPWRSGKRGDVTVGRNSTWWDSPHSSQYTMSKF
jgi:hypothetical protein